MKRVLLLSFFTLFILSSGMAQMTCEPDTTLEVFNLIYPQPYVVDEDGNATGGIPDTACADQAFEFTFTAFVPDTAEFQGQQVVFQFMRFDPETAISYEPTLEDFDYVCNPPDCIFLPEEFGCVKIFGTPAEGEVGNHVIQFQGTINFGIDFNVTFPNPLLAPGTYDLVVKEAGAGECINSLKEVLAGFDLRNAPNPFSSTTEILIDSEQSGSYEFKVHDMLGQLVERRIVDIFEGSNTLTFDGSALPTGMYMFSLSDGSALISEKMVISRR